MASSRAFRFIAAAALAAAAFQFTTTAQNPQAAKPASAPYRWKSVQMAGGNGNGRGNGGRMAVDPKNGNTLYLGTLSPNTVHLTHKHSLPLVVRCEALNRDR